MKILMTVLVWLVLSTSAFALDFNPGKDYDYTVEYGTHYLITKIVPIETATQKQIEANVVFIWDELDLETAWIFLLLKEEVDPGVDDYMLVFGGDLRQAFPMERFEDGEPNKDFLCEITRKQMMEFLHELTYSNTRLMKIDLHSSIDVSRSWVLEIDKIPDYVNH